MKSQNGINANGATLKKYVTRGNHMNVIAGHALMSELKTRGNGIVPYIKQDQSRLSFKEQDALTTIDHSFKPRWYQSESVDAIFDYFYKGGKGHPLIVVPTGAGKSHILGMFAKRVLDTWPEQRILILSHVDTILEQDYLALRKHLPANQVGMFSAGVGIKQRRAVTIAGIQSVTKKAALFKKTTIILVDECHSIPHKNTGQYRTFLNNFICPVVGLTATHFRLGTGYLHEGEGRLFTDVAYTVDIVKLIKQGHLCNLVSKKPNALINTDKVGSQGGDFIKKELFEASTRDNLTQHICEELATYKNKYKKWLVFAIDIDHAEMITALLNVIGVDTGLVHSKQTKQENRFVKASFKAGDYQALVSVESLTTGFDVPSVDLIALVRSTQSPVLHIQMIGRGLRIAEGKEHCLVLDFAGNVRRLGPINDVHIKTKGKGNGRAITKTCPECQEIVPGSTRFCPSCKHEFIFKVSLEDKASTEDIVRTKKKKLREKIVNWHTISGIAYGTHYGKSGLLTLKIVYYCGYRTFFEYINFDSQAKNPYYARGWWKERTITPNLQSPMESTEAHRRALKGELRTPTKIYVDESSQFTNIKDIKFGET